jgi:hypothetical protein
LDDNGTFLSRGREIKEIYKLPNNVTQQDGLFVSDRSAIGVELKLGSLSSVSQVLKYIMLHLMEENEQKRRLQIGLLFIVPPSSVSEHWRSIGLDGPHVDSSYIHKIDSAKLSKSMATYLNEHRDQIIEALTRLKIAAVSWQDFYTSIAQFQTHLETSVCGEQTAHRLLEGMRRQISEHEGTGVLV